MKYIASAPDYLSRAYPNISKSELFSYLQELAKAPAGRHLDQDRQISLFDYDGIYIHQKDGKRVTTNTKEQKRKVHVFGDSRVSGYMLEDKDLFTNILQVRLNQENIQVDVINYGIPGREIERMEYQIKKAHISGGDIVFVLTGCYEYRYAPYEKQEQFCQHIKQIKKICNTNHAYFCYINLPTTVEMVPASNDEQYITDIYRRYKFNEYDLSIINKYKLYILNNISMFGVYCVDLAHYFSNPHKDLLFINMHHYSPSGNRIISDVLFDIICNQFVYTDYKISRRFVKEAKLNVAQYVKTEKRKSSLLWRTKSGFPKKTKKRLSKKNLFFFRMWLRGVKNELYKNIISSKKVGAIVMNANPFTLGHLYLVETAKRQCDFLYVFVLNEDKSEFSYFDRINMVYEGTKHLKGVTVTSAGNKVISSKTFPEYFMKEELQNKTINAYYDIESFSLRVAPIYHINMRFFGEEPLDNITRQYNEQMKEVLPRFCIKAVEIPRKSDNVGVISATRVREHYRKEEWEKMSLIVPQTTLQYLQKLKAKK